MTDTNLHMHKVNSISRDNKITCRSLFPSSSSFFFFISVSSLAISDLFISNIAEYSSYSRSNRSDKILLSSSTLESVVSTR